MRPDCALQDVESVSAERKKLSSTFEIRFRDGSSAQFEVVRPAKPGPFIEPFARLKG